VNAEGKPRQRPNRPARQGRQQQDQGQATQQPAPAAPPPQSDKAAQVGITPAKVTPIEEVKGEPIKADAASAPQVQVPQNVTIINQTTVNNTTVNNTTNNTTNNVQNNNGPGVQQNAGRPGDQNNDRNGRDRGPRGDRDRNSQNPIGLGINVVVQLGNELIVHSPGRDHRRIADDDRDRTTYERLPRDRFRETVERPNGVKIVTIYNRNGDILRRSRFDRNGHEIVLAYFDPSRDEDLLTWRDPGEDLPPLVLDIPASQYVLDADSADEQEVQHFLAQPPVEHVTRLYSIDEVKRSARIRDMVRRLEIGDLTFDTGSATIGQDQVGNLSNVAKAMLDLLDKNPAETFLIEGHTDAVGSDISNLELSDARAATVARVLTDFYHIPPENLATQGYGERYLKVQTEGPERVNRRVTIRRITPLVTVAGATQ
jgi:outer membrane protein OmpA-like peptidoglycan-associated protein